MCVLSYLSLWTYIQAKALVTGHFWLHFSTFIRGKYTLLALNSLYSFCVAFIHINGTKTASIEKEYSNEKGCCFRPRYKGFQRTFLSFFSIATLMYVY
jgi:hypothetical protein